MSFILKNNNDNLDNKMMRCILSEQIKIQESLSTNYIPLEWNNGETIRREYINLDKKIMIDGEGFIFGIHKEKIKDGNGLMWGDIVIGENNDAGGITFSLVGDTFPEHLDKDVSNINIDEASEAATEAAKEAGGEATVTFTVLNNKRFFSPKIIQFCNSVYHKINETLIKKDGRKIDNEINYLNRGNGISILSSSLEKYVPNNIQLNDLYPNPFNSSITLEIKVEEAIQSHINIYNLNGQLVESISVLLNESNMNQIKINLSDNSAGIYFVNINVGVYTFLRKITYLK